jgi:hypothetical protein
VLTFVGRPRDWNKGLETFLDAIEVLVGLGDIPVFNVWLVGGSEHEMLTVYKWVAQRSHLRGLEEGGRLLVWGRVAPEALPELMSRSSVLVVPSNREQFGIVAIEAMMCGCPVLASRVGGLRDIVVDGRVGHLVSPGDYVGLAFALTGLLRLPAYWRSLGHIATRWATAHFTQASVFERLRRIYGGLPVGERHSVEVPDTFFVPALDRASRLLAERALGAPLRRLELMTESHGGATFALEADARKMVGKIVGRIPDLRGGLFRKTRVRRGVGQFEAYRIKLAFLAGSGIAPAVIMSDARREMLFLEWIDGIAGCMEPIVFTRLRCWRAPNANQCEQLMRAVDSLRRKRSAKALLVVDRVAFALNAQCAASGLPVHPGVELERVRQHLADRAWPLPPHLNERFRIAVDNHLDALSDSDCVPALRHGNVRPAHCIATTEGVRLVGLRMLRYAAGPLDEAQWVLHAASGLADGRLDAVATLAALSLYAPKSRMAVAWVAVEALMETLCAALRGDTTLLATVPAFLQELLTSPGSAHARTHRVDSRSNG